MLVCYFDTETNGSASEHRIVEFACILTQDNRQKEIDFLVRQDDISLDISQLTRITRNDILKYGIPEIQFAEFLVDLLSKKPVMVAHNCQFDLSMIFDVLERHYGSYEAYHLVSNCQWLDTLTIARDRKAYPHKLSDCIDHYHCDGQNSHNALDDTRALQNVFLAMMQERLDVFHYINVFGMHQNHPYHDNDKFGFITYKLQANNRGFVSDEDILPLR